MIPILFAENSTTYTTNGIGRLADAISCDVKEQRNGIYELEMEYPKTGRHYSDLGVRKIIVVKPSANASLQAFRIYKITKPIDGRVIIFAQHLCYDLVKNVAMPFSVTASSAACNSALQGLKSNAVETCPFTFWTDVTTVSSYTQLTPSSINQRLRGVEGSILDQFGGEYEWDNWTVKLHKRRGIEKPITLRYGKNITDLNQEENIANTVTGVVPFWINTDKTERVTLPERVVRSSNHTRYSHKLTTPLDLSREFEEKPTEEQLRTKATVYVNQSGFGLPKVSIKVSFIELADTEEYKEVLPLQAVSLCDTITVQFEELGINTTAEVVETDYDVLNERYNSIQIGALKSTLAMSINDMNASTIQAVQDESERVYAEVNTDVSDMVDNATAWLTSGNGYVVAVKNNDGSWKELLFMDDDDMDQARNVLRINENGLGFSSTGVEGPYTQAWTLDGRLIIGGTNVPSLTCYDSGGNIIFQAARDGVIWDAANSSMTRTGKLTIKNADITDGTIKLGGENDGVLEMYDEDERLMGEWTNEHLMFKKPGTWHTIEMKVDGGNAVLMFDDDSYIDGTGSGGEDGFHFNADNITFSTDDIFVTDNRNSSNYSRGYTGTATAIREAVRHDDDSWSFGFITLQFINGICVGVDDD
ncbi:MAG: phage tail protein [Lachnospiraceae bacterium]|nr:phage tail protein [Lachnospiraceae bacterium]